MRITKKKKPEKKLPKKAGDDRHKEIRSLGEERLDAIKSMMLDGKPCTKIAQTLQDEWGVLPHMSRPSLKRALTRYKNDEIDPKIALMSDALPDDLKEELVVRMKSQLDTLDEMKKLCVEQMARYQVLSIESSRTGKRSAIRDAAQEGQRLHGMLKELAHLQMEAGIIPRAPRIVSAHVNFQRSAAEDAYYNEVQLRKDVRDKTRLIVDKLSDQEIIDADYEEIEEAEETES